MKTYLFIFFLFLILNKAQSIEVKIIHKIQNEIITNIDIKNQFKYLIALNNSLKELDKEKILKISNNSIIQEKIKKIEISNNLKEITINEEYLNYILKNIYLKLNLKSLDEFDDYLINYGLILTDVEKKITIDALWNDLIFKKYASKIIINEEEIRNKISKNRSNKSKEYQLSEIVFEVKNKKEIETKYEKIIESIGEIGFENTAAIHSITETATMGGDIGWVNKDSLNSKINENINTLKIGEISKPIILSNGILLLKVTNIKNSKNNIDDVEVALKKAIKYEQNRQLNQYSKIYYNKIKKNLNFDE